MEWPFKLEIYETWTLWEADGISIGAGAGGGELSTYISYFC